MDRRETLVQRHPETALRWLSFDDHFVPALLGTDYFRRVADPERHALFELYRDQLREDLFMQTSIIDRSIYQRAGISDELRERGQREILRLGELAALPPLLIRGDVPLERQIQANWRVRSDQPGTASIPQLLSAFSHEVGETYTHTPSDKVQAEIGEHYEYARADIEKHSRVQEYLESLAFALFGKPYSEVNASERERMLIASSGAAIPMDVIQTLNRMRHDILDHDNARHFKILLLNTDSPYFETGRAVARAAPPGAKKRSPYEYISPSIYGWYVGPDVFTVSTDNDSPTLDEIIKFCRYGMNLLYAEPIGNNVAMDVPDLRKVFATLRQVQDIDPKTQRIFVLIDASVMGGLFNPIKAFGLEGLENINIVVMESLIKYLGYGTDKSNLGLVYGVGPDIPAFFQTMRQGLVMKGYPSLDTITAMPLADEKIVYLRKKRFGYNARFLAANLEKQFGNQVRVHYPGNSSHPQFARVQEQYQDFCGSIFFIELPDAEMYSRVESLMKEAGIEIGTSYGLNTTRAEVIRRREGDGEKKPIVIRISGGTENIKQLLLVLDKLERVLGEIVG